MVLRDIHKLSTYWTKSTEKYPKPWIHMLLKLKGTLHLFIVIFAINQSQERNTYKKKNADKHETRRVQIPGQSKTK